MVRNASLNEYISADKKIEKELLSTQKAALWEEENGSAINEQNERVARRGVFGDSVRRF